MKKISLLITFLTIIFMSCQDKNAFTIEGNFTEDTFNDKTIYLQKIDSIESQSSVVLDSAVIKNNKFKFKGTAEEGNVIMGFVSIGRLERTEPETPVGTLIIEPGKITITFDEKNVNVGGTPKNDEFNKMLAVMNKMGMLIEEVNKAGNVDLVPLDESGMDVNGRMMNLQEDMQKASYDFTKANMTNKAGQFLFFTSFSSFTKEQIKELITLADDNFRNIPDIQQLQEEVNRVIPEEGNSYADVQLIDLEGSRVNLSSYVNGNKCVLIDFWASWCRPCIQEMPNLVKTYNSYKGKGLEIIGISVDEDRQAWINAIQQNKMTWKQLGDDTQAASKIYGLTTIPHTILLDENGTIVAKNLRGKDLDDKIKEILDK